MPLKADKSTNRDKSAPTEIPTILLKVFINWKIRSGVRGLDEML